MVIHLLFRLFLCFLSGTSLMAMEKDINSKLLYSSHYGYEYQTLLKNIWETNKHKASKEIFLCLKNSIDQIEKERKVGDGYLYDFLHNTLEENKDPKAREIYELIKEEYFFIMWCTEHNKYGPLSLARSIVDIPLKIIKFFPNFNPGLDEQNGFWESIHKSMRIPKTDMITLKLLRVLLQTWYMFAHNRDLSFEQTCKSPYKESLIETLCKEIEEFEHCPHNTIHLDPLCALLEHVCRWALNPLKTALFYYILNKEINIETLHNTIDPSLTKDLLKYALHLKKMPIEFDIISILQADQKYQKFIEEIQNEYTDYLADHITTTYVLEHITKIPSFQGQQNQAEALQKLLIKKLIHRYYYNKFTNSKTLKQSDPVTACAPIQSLKTAFPATMIPPVYMGSADGTITFYELSKNDTAQLTGSHTSGFKVYAIEHLNDSQYISCSADRTVRLRNKDPLREVSTFYHTCAVHCFLIVDNTYLFSGLEDGTIHKWDLEAKKDIKILSGHNKEVLCLAQLTPTCMVSSSADKTICLWDLATNKCTNTFRSEDEVRCIQVLNRNSILVGLSNGELHIINCSNGTSVQKWKGHTKAITSLRFLDKVYLVSASLDNTIKIWNLASDEHDKPVQTLRHTSEVHTICIVDPFTIISGCQNGSINLWKCPSFTLLKDLLQDLKARERKRQCCIQ